MNEVYKKQVALLIRIIPSVYRVADFAVHGGTAIINPTKFIAGVEKLRKVLFIT
jgi:hypothetical protein